MPKPPEVERFNQRAEFRFEHPESIQGITDRGFLIAGSLNLFHTEIGQLYDYNHKAHRRQTRLRIMGSVDNALSNPTWGHRSALILEPDESIPLEDIAREFDKVTLVALHPKNAAEATSRLEYDQQRKVHVVHADMSGAISTITQTIDTSLMEAYARTGIPGPEGYYAWLAQTLPQVPLIGNSPNFVQGDNDGRRYDLVISANALSGLKRYPGYYAQALGHELFTDESKSRDEVDSVLLEMSTILTRGHVRLLADSVAPKGEVCFIDKTQQTNISPSGLRETVDVVPSASIDPALDMYFQSTRNDVKRNWTWDFIPDRLQYDMASRSLTPKKIVQI